MKALHINSNYLCTKLHDQLVEELNKLGIDNKVYTPRRPDQLKVLEPKDYVIESVCINNFDRINFLHKTKKIYKDLVKKISDINGYDIIHAHTLFTDGYIAYKCHLQYGIPYIVAVRNTDVNIFLKYMLHLRRLGLEILKCASCIIFLSEKYRENVYSDYIPDKIKDELNTKTVVIPNGIGLAWLNNPKSKKKEDNKKVDIVFAGAINKNKNLTATLKACKLLIEQGYDVRYTVIGKVYSEDIHTMLTSEDFVSYLGVKTPEEMMNIYEQQDIFVMPSKHETFGLVYAEAMSQGLPVIYTKNEGFDGQFPDGEVGYAVNCEDAGDIADKIELVINNYNRLSENCVRNVDKFRWDKIAQRYVEIYNDILRS